MRSWALVALQLSLMVAIALPVGDVGWNAAGTVLVGAGVAIGLWALSANRPGNFNVRPEPRAGGRLVIDGPYRYLRHPMYLAVLVVAAGFCVGYATPWRWATLLALAVVLRIKAGVEERAMAARHPGYGEYARTRRRFLPFLW